MKLNSKQRKYLRSKAHHLKPVVIIGKSDFSESIVDTIDSCLSSHELIKVKFAHHKDKKKDIIDKINTSTNSECVGFIGNISIIFRQNSDTDRRIYKID